MRTEPVERRGTRLCRLDELPDGGARGFDPAYSGRHTLFVLRRGAALYAYRDACPHHGTPMAWREHAYLNADGTRIVCHAHGAQFQPETGACTLGPCVGAALQKVVLHIAGDGTVVLPQDEEDRQ